MANYCFTFEIDGRPILVAFEDEAKSWARHRCAWDAVEGGQPVIRPGSVVSMRLSTSVEIDSFVRVAAEACLAGRIDWADVMDGYPIFTIDAADPNFPDEHVTTGLPLGHARAPRPPRAFGISLEHHSALYHGASSRAYRQAA